MKQNEMLVFILFGTAYEIKTVTGKLRYNISCQTLGYSSQVNEPITSDTIIPSLTCIANGDSPQTNTCSKCTGSRKQSSLNRQHSGEATRRLQNAESYEVIL